MQTCVVQTCIRPRGYFGTRALERIGCPSKHAPTAGERDTHIGSRSFTATVYVHAREAFSVEELVTEFFCECLESPPPTLPAYLHTCLCQAACPHTCLSQAVWPNTCLFQTVYTAEGICLIQTIHNGVVECCFERLLLPEQYL